MKIKKTIWAGLCLTAISLPLWSQNSNQAIGIPGHLDARTGAFKPMPLTQTETDTTALASIGGKFVVNLTITVDSALAATDVISCSASATVFDVGSSLDFLDTATVVAVRKGSTATCTVNIPYSWALTTTSTDMVQLDYEIIVPATTTGGPYPSRSAVHGLARIKVPAGGATTTFNAATVI